MMIDKDNFGRVHLFYLGCLAETISPCLRLVGRLCSQGVVTEPSKWRKGLILGSHHLGDVLWRTNSLDVMKQHYPTCEWYYLCSTYSEPVLRCNPALRQILPFYNPTGRRRISFANCRILHRMRFDVALCTEKYQYHQDVLLAVRLGIPNIVAYTYKGFSKLVTNPIPLSARKPYPAYFRDYVAHLTGAQPSWSLTPKLYLDEVAHNEAVDFIWRKKIQENFPLTAVFVGFRTRQWFFSSRQIARIIRTMYQKYGMRVVLCGIKSHEAELMAIAQDCQVPAVITAGELSIRGLASLMKRCSLVFCPDSGPRHIANAVGTPVVFVRNLFSDRVETGSYCSNEWDLAAGLDFDAVQRPPYEDLPLCMSAVEEALSTRINSRRETTGTNWQK